MPRDLDLSSAVGCSATQLRVGQFDLQFTLGDHNFGVQSEVTVYRGADQVAAWREGMWPEPGFYDVMNTVVVACEVEDERTISIHFENGLEMRLIDDSDQFETMTINNDDGLWVI